MPRQDVKPFKFPHEQDDDTFIEVEDSTDVEIDVGGGKNSRGEKIEEPEPEIEVVDDTPKADRNRKKSAPPEEVTDEELEHYSDKVKKRIKHFSKGYHDERRAKEEAQRERDELQRVLQSTMDENAQLKNTSQKSQKALIAQAKQNADMEHKKAQAAYKAAYDTGDSDRLLEAQEALIATKNKVDRLANYRPSTGQTAESNVQVNSGNGNQQTQQQPAPNVDQRAQEWAKTNDWFGKDEEMTSLALGYHKKLVSQGMDPTSDEYYEKIDSRMRQVFPDEFEDVVEEQPKPRQQNSVVAPATRSTTPKKIRLTQTQVRLAKRLGLTPEQYAKQVAIDARNYNG